MRSIVILIMSLFFVHGVSLADTVVLTNNDIIRGQILNKTFEIQSSYSALTINTDIIKGIFFSSSEMDDDEVQTINNDYFSGDLIFETIKVLTAGGQNLEVKKGALRAIRLDNRGKTKETETTLFFMVNGDKFSGRLIDGDLTVRTEYAEKNIRSDTLSRIGFVGPGQTAATIRLNTGSLFKGDILERRFLIQPDSMREISVCIGKIASIQFNVSKLIAGQYNAGGSAFDFDSDGVADIHDECPDTGCGIVTDEKGCRPPSDSDGDGVADPDDWCAGTPAGVTADSNGCWVIQATMFELDKATISPDFYTALDEVAGILERNPALSIEVQGHADNVGSAEYNLKLTGDRARAVVAHLVGIGIDSDRLSAVGYGFSQPKASNDTKEGRALNRRVELVPLNEQ